MKKMFLLMMVVLIVGSGLRAQSKDTLYSNYKNLPIGFIVLPIKEDSFYIKGGISMEIEPQFPRGYEAFQNYINRNINKALANKYIELPKGQLTRNVTILVYFLIDRDGNVVDAYPDSLSSNSLPEKLVEEAIRVIKKSPKWFPAVLNGRKYLYKAKQEVTFTASKK